MILQQNGVNIRKGRKVILKGKERQETNGGKYFARFDEGKKGIDLRDACN